MDGTHTRIIRLMKDRGIQDQQLIESIGLPRGTFSNWKREKGKSYYLYIDRISDYLGVSVEYLVRGRETAIATQDLSDNEAILLEGYRGLDEEEKRIILDCVRLFLKIPSN